jgi:hypothetical protein
VITGAALTLLAIAVLALAFETRRVRQALPLIVFLSAMTWLPFEAFVDIPMALWHAAGNPLIAMHVLDRPLPVYVEATGAAFFLGGYGIYRLILRGASLRSILAVAVALGVLDYVLEMTCSHFHIIEYYGHNPARVLGLPIYAMVQNVGVYIVQAWVILTLAPHIRGWRGLLFLPAMPSAYIAYAFGCTFPAYIVVQSSASAIVAWPAIVIATAMNAIVPIVILRSRAVAELRERALSNRLRESDNGAVGQPALVGRAA